MMSNLVLPPCLVTSVIGLPVDGVVSESTFLFFSFFYCYIHGYLPYLDTSRLPNTYSIIKLLAEISGWTNLSIATYLCSN